MLRSLLAVLLVNSLCVGCQGKLVERTDTVDDLPECVDLDMRLVLEPSEATVGAGGLLVFSASGGTGDYRFSFDTNESGARIEEDTGFYVAGRPQEDPPTIDSIELRDEGCRGSAFANITVVDALALVPARAEVRPGTTIEYEAQQGSGNYRFELVRNDSGGSLDGNRYTAGASSGRDTVRVFDEDTGETADGVVDVNPVAGLRVTVERIVLPLGSGMPVPVDGGSGEFETRVDGEGVVQEGNRLVANAVGRYAVTFADRFVGDEVSAEIHVVESPNAPSITPGDRSPNHRAVAVGDVDGDGFPDAVISMSNRGVDAHRSGAVFVFAGTGDGLVPEPARVISGQKRDELFGYALAAGDVDGDGLVDLLVGAPQANSTRSNAGAVYVYRGLGSRYFTANPAQVFAGAGTSDRFGRSIALCDFNGDGALDIAVGAGDAENLERSPRANQQGAVYVFLSYEGRFVTAPDVTLYGEIPDGSGGWTAFDNMRLGDYLAAGDVDGDSICDLVVYAQTISPERTNDGAVFVYRGMAAVEGGSRGGPAARPAVIWGGADEGDQRNYFGQRLDVGDLDGDGMADIAIGQYLHDEEGNNDIGASYFFRGRDISGTADAILSPTTADWSVLGERGGDWAGRSILFADVDGDDSLELVTGDARMRPDEESEISRPGLIRVWQPSGDVPANTPDEVVLGPMEEDNRFGMALGNVGDVDGDGGDDLIAFAPYYDGSETGYDDGAALLVSSRNRAPAPLTLPYDASGSIFGFDTDVADLDGDGNPELIVGAPRGTAVGRLEGGFVYIYRGTATGFENEPSVTLGDFPGHSSDDELGWAVGHGDFDGDGTTDVLVVARNEDRPTTFDEAYTPDAECAGSQSNPGALYVFRGRSGMLPDSTPALVFYGPRVSRGLRSIAVADIDDDGADDVLVGGLDWRGPADDATNAGGFAIVRGGTLPSGTIGVRCAADAVVDGPPIGGQMAAEIAAIGDLDGDGCAEWSVGLPNGELDPDVDRDQGLVYVYYGYDAWSEVGMERCASTSLLPPVRFHSGSASAQAGRALAGGEDLDGDGLGDLVIGATDYRDGRGEIGRVYALLGSRIQAERMQTDSSPILAPMSTGMTLDGVDAGELLGTGLTMVPGIGPSMNAGVAAGGPQAAMTGNANTGGVRIYAFGSSGFEPTPWAWLVGEADFPLGQMGGSVSAGVYGGRVYLVAGAYWSDARSLDDGAVFASVF